MAVHQPHLLDFSSPPPPSGFDNDGLLALHVVDMQSGGDAGVLSGDDTAPPIWPQDAVSSLSLFNNYSSTATAAGASLASHHHHRPAPPVVPVEPNQLLLQVVPAEESLLQRPFQLRSSKYLAPVRELLSEFCSLEGDLFHAAVNAKRTAANNKAGDDVEAMPSSGGLWGSPSLMMSSMDLMELERRKVRLLSMVQEVDRRYRRYRDQMKSVEVWFEAVAGVGASQVYTRLARRAMSRHFRCLRDALVAQGRALKRKEKGGVAGSSSAPPPAGATKGATPRLRVLEKSLRQQRAFQQHSSVGAMEMMNRPWRPQRGLPERAVAVLRAWLFEHFLHPYPNDVDKHVLARQTGLSRSQVSNWFINARVRLWKPMIEDMYKDEVNPQQPAAEAANHYAPARSTIVKTERMSTSSSILGGERSYCYQQLHGSVGTGGSSSIIATDSGDLRRLFHKQCTRSYPNLTN